MPERYSGSRKVFEGFFLPAPTPLQFGISTPRNAGKAVRRNRIKRIMRETFRLNKSRFPDSGSLLFQLKQSDDEAAILHEMLSLTEKLKLKIDGGKLSEKDKGRNQNHDPGEIV